MQPAALTDLLRCPETGRSLRVAPADLLASVNERIARGDLKNRAGRVVSAPLQAAFVRADGRLLYPVREGLPILLVGEGIVLAE